MKDFEITYALMVQDIIANGKVSKGRNGTTVSMFGKTLEIDMTDSDKFPLLVCRKIFHKGILGEFTAFLKGPTCVDDFKKEGCNYWGLWADAAGALELDYGNAWTDWAGTNQLAIVIDSLRNDQHGRRHLINAWDATKVHSGELSLPCCHYGYQWYVTDTGHLDMIWLQRSVDMMIGLPSDIVLHAAFNLMMAKLTGYKPGKLIMQLGDCHVYEEHITKAKEYINLALYYPMPKYPTYTMNSINDYWDFEANTIAISDYTPKKVIKFELKE